jgi:MoxR-like ATPase
MSTTHGTPAERLATVRAGLKAAFVERDGVVDALLTALIAGEHVLLLGPPGTAKSALVNALAGSIDGARCFVRLLTRFSGPEELFGPVSLAGLKADRYKRNTAGYLPECEVGFVDEVFKANSAILNSLLTLMQERAFDNDGARVPCPLLTLVGASNELPEGRDLEAMFDRFALRLWVGYVADRDKLAGLLRQAVAGGNGKAPHVTLSLDDVRALQAQAAGMPVGDDVLGALCDVKADLEAAGAVASDRTWCKAVRLLQARAVLDGDTAVTCDHLEVLCDALWREPSQRPVVQGEVGKRANPVAAEAVKLLDMAKAAFAAFPEDVNAGNLGEAGRINGEVRDMIARGTAMLAGAPEARTRKMREALAEMERLRAQMVMKTSRAAGLI